MDFYQLEAEDGIRMVWNNMPSTKLAATRAVLPIAAHYTPYKDLEQLKAVDYDPVRCRCSAILNPYCQVDFRSKQWVCPFCHSRNPFTQMYRDYISETNLPLELQQENLSIEYQQKQGQNQKDIPNVFLYVIDTCISQEDMDALKESIQESLNYIPQDSYVGLITYGRFVFVHELGFQECPKSYALKGNKTYTPQQIQQMLGLSVRNDPRGASTQETLKRFLLKLEDCQFTLSSIIDNLQPDSWVVGNQERQQRATGTALNVAISLMESSPFQGSRIMNFVGGPCTVGPGQIVDLDLAQTIRSYLDITKENDLCKHINKAKKYYQSLTQRAIKVQTVVDLYAFSVDQVGILEMRTISEKTGGYTVMNEEFNSDVFKATYKKIFDLDPETNELKMATAAKIDLFVSKEIKINGALGNLTSLKKTGPMVAEQEIGQGGTNSWYMGGIDRNSTATFMFDLNSQNKDVNTSKSGFFQYQTLYKSPSGKMRLRVTTVARKFADQQNIFELSQGFDQEAACVAMARWGIWKAEQEDSLEVLKWLDRTLIRLVTKFGSYKRDDPNSFNLSKEFSLYPQFMYHLRRSHFIQTFGASPDEIAFYRVTLNRENVTNCLVMIQPALLQYTLESDQPMPVTLDQNAMQNRVILLLDTYFQVITWKGDHIKKWIDQEYHLQEDYANLKELIEAPLEDVKLIMEDRFPVPIFFETHEGHSKERYLKSRVNPSGNNQEANDQGHYITDDASLKLFMDHLIKLAVTSQN